jgi:hypothetical protein
VTARSVQMIGFRQLPSALDCPRLSADYVGHETLRTISDVPFRAPPPGLRLRISVMSLFLVCGVSVMSLFLGTFFWTLMSKCQTTHPRSSWNSRGVMS